MAGARVRAAAVTRAVGGAIAVASRVGVGCKGVGRLVDGGVMVGACKTTAVAVAGGTLAMGGTLQPNKNTDAMMRCPYRRARRAPD